MLRMTRGPAGKLAMVATTVGVLATGAVGAHAAAQRATSAATTLRVAITDHGLYVDGPRTFPAGLVHVTFEDAKVKHDATIAVLALAPGHTWHEFRSDLKVAFENLFAPHGDKKKGLKYLNHVLTYATGYGGMDAHAGETPREGTLLLSNPNSQYFLYDDSGNLPNRPKLLTTTGAAGAQTLPATSATVVAMTNRRFGGDSVLPANGTVTFENKSTESPHFLVLQQVKNGTTRKQVIAALQSNSGPGPFLHDEASSDVVSYGHAMNLHVHVHPGTYAEMCFFPDPKTGMPHAFMGMVRIVHLK